MRPFTPADHKAALRTPQQQTRRDLLWLLGWTGLLIATSQIYPSLMAHDEGNYALESRFMLESGDWLARQFWGELTYSHGIMLNWLIMICYQLLGSGAAVSADWAVRIARLPVMLSCLGAVALTYDIGKILAAQQRWPDAKHARQIGMIAAMLLMLISVWTQYSHLATQDMLLVTTELLGIWSLLRVEVQPRWRWAFGFLAGLAFGLGYLIKTFMIVLPAIALLPYLIFEHRRHRHLTNPGLYGGLIVGMGAVVAWVGLSVQKHGSWVLDSMFGKIGELSAESFHADGGPFYYLWNIPVNMVPWILFAVIGVGMVLSSPGFWKGFFSLKSAPKESKSAYPHRWLLLYPLLMLGMLTLFTTKTAYYTLQLHPFLALFSAIALHRIAIQKSRWPRQTISYIFCLLGLVLLSLAPIVFFGPAVLGRTPELFLTARPYAPIPILLGAGWFLLPFLMNQPQKWIGAWLLSGWLTLGAIGLLGFFGNYSADVKTAMTTGPIASIVQSQPVDFLKGQDWPPGLQKGLILIAFHTPYIGQLNPPTEALPPGSYVWVADNFDMADELPQANYETIAQVRQWRLIRL